MTRQAKQGTLPGSKTIAKTDVLPAVSAEMAEFVRLSGDLTPLLQKAIAFFQGANALEAKAKAALAVAEKMKAPKTAHDDAALQLTIKSYNAGKVEAVEYWRELTTLLYDLHRRSTTGRGRATAAFESAAIIGNRFHNDFVDAQELKAKLEQDRIRKAAEDKAAEDRRVELDRLEAAAIAGEEASEDLSARETAFVDAYVAVVPTITFEATAAQVTASAKRAGYADPAGQGVRLLGQAKILDAIKGKREAIAARQQLAAVQAEPVRASVPDVRANVQRVAGVSNRTYRKADVFEPAKLVAAVLAGTPGIPSDVLMVNQAKCNEYAESLKDLINKWPGVRLVTDRKIV